MASYRFDAISAIFSLSLRSVANLAQSSLCLGQ